MSDSLMPTLHVAGQEATPTLPMLIANKWKFPLDTVVHESETYYRVVDWINGLILRDRNAVSVWGLMKVRNSRYRSLDIAPLCINVNSQCYASQEGLLRIALCLPPYTGIRNAVLKAFILKAVPDELVREKNDPKPQCVYILKCGWPEYQDVYKIGYSQSAQGRIAGLDRQYPFSIEILLCCEIENARQVEQDLHKRFSSQHVRGEWFRLRNDDLEEIYGYIRRMASESSEWLAMDLLTGRRLLEE